MLFLSLVMACFLVIGHAEHRPDLAWMTRYSSASGIGCCSELDCVPAPVAVVAFGQTETTVVIDGAVIVLPAKSVHQSENGETYWCYRDGPEKPPNAVNTRCVFYAVGG